MKTLEQLEKEFYDLGWIGDCDHVWHWIADNFSPKEEGGRVDRADLMDGSYKSNEGSSIRRQIALSPAAAEYANQLSVKSPYNSQEDHLTGYVDHCFEFADEFLKQERERQ